MRAFWIAALLASAASPVLAQHADHGAPAQPAPSADPNCPAEHAAMGHCVPAEAATPATPPVDPHADHARPKPPASRPSADPHAGHAGHAKPEPSPAPAAADPHAGHGMSGAATAPVGPDLSTGPNGRRAPQEAPPPAAFAGPEHAADLVFGADEMAQARATLNNEHGDIEVSRFSIDRLEVAFGGRDAFQWDDVQFWSGGDINKLWFKSRGEGVFGDGLESAEVQALLSRAIDPWFDLQAGVRYDHRPDGPERGYLVLGLQGLAPYWFEVDAAAFVSNEGEVSARLEAEYDQRITRSLVLQPAAELEFALQDSPEIGVGSGLSTMELGLRLRHDFYPKSGPAVISPYLGVEFERSFGETARFAREEGEDVKGWRFLLGLRTWF